MIYMSNINDSTKLEISCWSILHGHNLRYISIEKRETHLIEIFSKDAEILGIYFTLK
jgi:hypothetical protein